MVEEITRDGAREAARRELSRPEYVEARPSWLERLVERVSRFFSDRIEDALDVVGGSILPLVVLALLAALGIVALRLRLGPLRPGDRLSDRRLGARMRTAADYRREAEVLAAGGQWKEALRARFRAVARDLEERGVLDPRPGRTAAEVAAEAGVRMPAVAAELHGAATLFDEVWYGGRPAAEASYRSMSDAERRISESRATVAVPA